MLGLLVASFFVVVGEIVLFLWVRRNLSGLRQANNFSPGILALALVAASYPFWAAVGALLVFLFLALTSAFPGQGLGSPNAVFTLTILSIGVSFSVLIALIAKRFIFGIGFFGFVFIGVFGWLLPHFIS